MNIQIRLFFLVAVLANVTACSYIKTWFPDKEKDYQFTTEIPPLILPPDLAGDAIAKIPTATSDEKSDRTAAAPTADSVDEVPTYTPSNTSSEIASTAERKSIQIDIIDAEQGSKRLRIATPTATAWRLLGKALSRKSIEVTNRNQEEGIFQIQYSPTKQDVEDGSFWDEIIFAVKGFDVSEQAYVLKLVEANQQSEVILLDNEQKPVTDQAGFNLLKHLHDTIKADLAK